MKYGLKYFLDFKLIKKNSLTVHRRNELESIFAK